MQTLDEFIQKIFNDKSAFAEFIDVSTFQVTKWISDQLKQATHNNLTLNVTLIR
jgi:hypothetical protein